MKNRICKISLFSAILASFSALPVEARVVVNSKNSGRSYADAYNQVNAVRYQQEYLDATATNVTTASATANLPVLVSDERLASAILNNSSSTTVAQLENCAMIYPNGVFRWETPESGIRQNQLNQCVAVVSLVNATTNEVLATTTLAAGDAMKCNIDSFPETGMNVSALSKTELPADAAPTMGDVEDVMNQEQKQNAGIKIAAGAIISAVAGNALSKKEAGNTAILGTGKDQLKGTAIGAVTGAGIMAASTYTGKVAGDTIKSTAVDAAAGAVVGNMLAGQSGAGNFLNVKKCKIGKVEKTENAPEISAGEYDCIVGRVEFEGNDYTAPNSEDGFRIVNLSGTTVKECTKKKDSDLFTCETISERLLNIYIDKTNSETVPLKSIIIDKNKNTVTEARNYKRYFSEEKNSTFKLENSGRTLNDEDVYFKVASAKIAQGNAYPAYAIIPGGVSGKKTSDWDGKYTALMYRNSDGSVGSEIKDEKTYFTPISISADDGALVDFSNPGRTKGTLTGATAGGALGGFAGYQGARTEITDRWVAASREYEDSLSNFVCMTGTRYLGKYNDYIEIPEPNKTDK